MSIIKKYWTYIVIVVLVAILSIQHSCNVRLRSDNAVLIHKNDSSFLVAKQYLDHNNKLVNRVNTHELTIRQLKDYGDQLGFDNKQLRKQVGSLNNLVGYWRGQASTKDSVLITLTDTIIVEQQYTFTKTFNWTNNYLSLDGKLDLDRNKLDLDYKYDVKFELAAYYIGRNVFRDGQLVADIKFADQNMKVREFSGFAITQPKKKWYDRKLIIFGGGLITGYLLGK